MAKVEKWVLNKSLHLGIIKESFASGAVIEHDAKEGSLKIDGQRYDSDKDLQILKKAGWVDEYSKGAKKKASDGAQSIRLDSPEDKTIERHMEVVESDADLMNVDIDIRHTKVGQNRMAKEEKDRAERKENLEVIRGDESPQERLQRLQSTIPKMEIVKDDSLGIDGSSALNSGQVVAKSPSEIREIKNANIEQAGKTDDVKPAGKKRGRPKGSKNKPKSTATSE